MSLSDFIQQKPVLETERLTLRTLTVADVPDLKEWSSHPSLYTYWGKRPGKNDLNPELLFQKAAAPTKSFHWGIVDKSANKVIGEIWIYLIENDRMAKVAYRLSPFYQGHGLMAEALKCVVEFCFTHTELRRLWADVHIDNHASYKTLERAGFLREGLIRQGKAVNMYCDYYIYGLLKPGRPGSVLPVDAPRPALAGKGAKKRGAQPSG